MNTERNSTMTCSLCGKKFIMNVPDRNKVCNLILKQLSLRMCDDCYRKYLKDREEAAS